MNVKDKLFIFVTGVLILLFTLSVFENQDIILFERSLDRLGTLPLDRPGTLPLDRPGGVENTTEVLNGLLEAGLAPQEAGYYEVIDD